jgi:hypothetical protein
MVRSSLVKKARFSFVQSPGCTVESTNGITVPLNVKNPIPASFISPGWLNDWDIAIRDLLLAAASDVADTNYSDQDGVNDNENGAGQSLMLANDAIELDSIGGFGFLSSDDEME